MRDQRVRPPVHCRFQNHLRHWRPQVGGAIESSPRPLRRRWQERQEIGRSRRAQARAQPLLGPFQHRLIFEEQRRRDQRRQPPVRRLTQHRVAATAGTPQRRDDDIGIENDANHIL